MSYLPKTAGQCEAVNYLNAISEKTKYDLIVGGHSKGGTLALVSAMELNKLKQNKIIRIYNNDGPGLRKREFESKKYSNIKNKYIHIVPYNSFIGIMLRHSNYRVVDSYRNTVLSHYPISWLVEESQIKEAELKQKSKDLEKNIINWLDNHNDFERIQSSTDRTQWCFRKDSLSSNGLRMWSALSLPNYLRIIICGNPQKYYSGNM